MSLEPSGKGIVKERYAIVFEITRRNQQKTYIFLGDNGLTPYFRSPII